MSSQSDATDDAMPRRTAMLGAGLFAFATGAVPATSAQDAVPAATGHVVLLGDSVFDNAGYLANRGPDVVDNLRARLAVGWRATLLARGGSVAADVPGQLRRLPPDATHLVVSAGGNDAGRREGVLAEPARSVAEALGKIASIRDRFAEDYRAMLDAVSARRLPVAVCTVFDPRFADPNRRRVVVVALAAFNDIITREAFARSQALIDLRLICGSDEDFAAATGPSAQGGAKIAAAIAGWVAGDGSARRRSSEVFAGEAGGGR
jgi:lysophospholipase L1-like esterase